MNTFSLSVSWWFPLSRALFLSLPFVAVVPSFALLVEVLLSVCVFFVHKRQEIERDATLLFFCGGPRVLVELFLCFCNGRKAKPPPSQERERERIRREKRPPPKEQPTEKVEERRRRAVTTTNDKVERKKSHHHPQERVVNLPLSCCDSPPCLSLMKNVTTNTY